MESSESFHSSRHRGIWHIVSIFFLSVTCCHQVYAQSQQELLFFTAVDALKITSRTTPTTHDSFVRPAVDVLYSYSDDKFRFLAEYFWSSHESELERLKAGWQMGDSTMLWLGRHHSTSNFWATEYHHGQFLQTAITRPSIDQWEDESGPMPSHITGLFLEHESLQRNETAINYAFSVGLGPQFVGDELVPFDLLNPGSGHDVSIGYRMAYRPSVLTTNQIGFLSSWSEIDVVSESAPELSDLNHIRQFSAGVFVDWNWNKWRLIGNFVYLNNDMQYVDGSSKDEFVSGYVQGEYKASQDWTIFGRTENGFNEDESAYLRLLPAFIAHRNMIGARWDFATFQSLTIEVADTSAQGDGSSHDNFKEARLQWSAVFP